MKDICEIKECCKPKRRKKAPYCQMHYARSIRHGDPTISKLENTHRGHVGCTVEGCANKHNAKGLCKKHHHEKHTASGEGKTAEKEAQRRYYQTPKGRAANQLKRQRRRHLEKDHVKLTASDVLRIKRKFQHECFNCGAKRDLTLDHHVPLSKGGMLSTDNTVLLCRTCNGEKADLDPEKYYSPLQVYLLNIFMQIK